MAFFPTNDSGGLFRQGSFTIDQNSTPEMIRAKRAQIAALMPQYGKARYVGEGIGQLANGIMSGRRNRALDKFEGERSSEATDQVKRAMSRLGNPINAGPLSILGMPREPVTAAPDTGGGLPPSLVASESGGDWTALNSEGYGGRGQFGEARLADAARAGIIPAGMTGEDFSRAPKDVQVAVENWHRKDVLGDLGKYVGRDVDGPGPIPPLTEDSLLSVAHLGGKTGAKKFIESGGRYNPTDSNGTRLSDYATRHAGGNSFQTGTQANQSGPLLNDLMAAAMNPWLTPAQRGMINGQIQLLQGQQQREQDRRSSREDFLWEQQNTPTKRNTQYVDGVGLIDKQTGEVVQRYDDAGSNATEYGLTPQFVTDANGNLSMVQLSKDGVPKLVELPEGLAVQKGVEKLDLGTSFQWYNTITGQPIGEPIAKDNRGAARETAIGGVEGKAKAQTALDAPGNIAQADETIRLIDQVLKDPALPSVVGRVQGRIDPNGISGMLMGQDALNLMPKIEQLQGKAFLQAFEGLKGGGQITEREGQAATAAITRLNQRYVDEKSYKKALEDLRRIANNAKKRAKGETVPEYNPEGSGDGTGRDQAAGKNPYIGMSDAEFSKINIDTLTPEQMDQLFEARQ